MPHLSRTHLACLASLRHSAPNQAQPSHACLALPNQTRTRVALRRPACRALTDRSLPVLSTPHPATPAVPRPALPHVAIPRLACRALPDRAAPYQTDTRLAQPAIRSQSVTNFAAPIPACGGYLMPYFFITPFACSVGTTLKRPKPQPALALLSGRPAPIPTCIPQRATRLSTSDILN